MQSISLHAFREPKPGRRWQQLFDATWPAYRNWYLRDGRAARATRSAASAALREHMPELVPTWRRLSRLAGDDDTAASFLTAWNLPTFAPGCSQVVVQTRPRALIRNYDYHPDLFEQVSMSTTWLDREVIGTSDCLWGLLDGMNDCGLVVSLTFGGAPGGGEGFGIPLVVRYLLETSRDVEQAVAALRRLPIGMSYNLTMSDRSGKRCTAYVGPGLEPEVRAEPTATNQRFDEAVSPSQERRFSSGARRARLGRLVDLDPDTAAEQFLRAPLRQLDYAGGFGTLYTADYRPDSGELHYRWPGTTWTRGFDSTDAELRVDVAAA